MLKYIVDQKNHLNSSQIMLWVLIALIPAMITKTYIYGWGVVLQIIAALIFANLFEWLGSKILGVFSSLKNNSASVAAVILGLSIPPYTEWYVILIASFFAIIVAKTMFGGLGNNIFNPAMFGYLIVLISFATQMLSWSNPATVTLQVKDLLFALKSFFYGYKEAISLISVEQIDGYTSATWLFKMSGARNNGDLTDLLQNQGLLQETLKTSWQLPLAYTIGGLLLIWKKIINIRIPFMVIIGFILTNIIVVELIGEPDISFYGELIIGNLIFCAFFIATEPVSRPQSVIGQYIFAFLVGSLTYIIRYFSNYYDGVAFAILICNLLTPTIEASIRRIKA